MTDALMLFRQAMILVVQLSTPMIAAAVLFGVLISLIQALMQLQEQTLPFAVKLVAVGATLALSGRWMGLEIIQLLTLCYEQIPYVGR